MITKTFTKTKNKTNSGKLLISGCLSSRTEKHKLILHNFPVCPLFWKALKVIHSREQESAKSQSNLVFLKLHDMCERQNKNVSARIKSPLQFPNYEILSSAVWLGKLSKFCKVFPRKSQCLKSFQRGRDAIRINRVYDVIFKSFWVSYSLVYS